MRFLRQQPAEPLDGDRTLVIMAKAPRLGQVKTRLCRNIPAAAVVELYRCLLEDTIALAQSLNGVRLAIMCPASDLEDLSCATTTRVRVVAQSGQGLAAALTSVFAQFATAQHRVIALNSDSPHLPASVLLKAFDALASFDLVVGPTHDGGYYLVGAADCHPSLFENDGMGTASALEGLLMRASALRLSVGFTEQFYDIDVAADLSRLSSDLELAPERAPRTAAWLSEWRRALPHLPQTFAHP
jgi:rSAM/selenodomain-associated transferase 1